MDRVVIVGAGHAGGSAAAFLRQYGFEGAITLIGDEPHAPYQRPPLSKAWLKGEADAEGLALKPLDFYAANGIDLRRNLAAASIDRSRREVVLTSGDTLPYDHLIIATGAAAITLPVPGADLEGVMTLRTAADAERLKAALGPGSRLCIVGGGYIGLEVAASGRSLGAEVTILERERRLLARVACEPLSTFLQAYHEQRGVAFGFERIVDGIVGERGRVAAVSSTNGEVHACDVVVVGVGARPNVGLAVQAGLAVDDGVVVDAAARSITDARIFAIGDVARRPMPIYGCDARLESVPNALEQAKQAAAAIVDRTPPAIECPWQWSDQYDLKLQIAGYPFDADAVVLRGEPSAPGFAVYHLKGRQVQAVEAVNAPGEFMAGKKLILSRQEIDPLLLGDPSIPLRSILQ